MPPAADSDPKSLHPGVPGAPFLSNRVERALCLLVVSIMVIAVAYAAWVGIVNFSRIGV